MKTNPEVEAYLKRKKWSYDDKNPSQYVIKVCPYCGDRKSHFFINKVTGQHGCWKCEAEGNLYTLKKDLGDIANVSRLATSRPKISKDKYNLIRRKVLGYHNALKANKRVKKILKEQWGFGNKAIVRFKLGVQKKGRLRWLVIPQFEDKRLVNVKYRTLPPAPKKFKRETGMKSALFNMTRLDPKLDYVYLFEGETDTMNADAYLGLPNCLGVTVGARAFKEEWIDFLDQFVKIYLVYDNDPAGQKGAEKIAFRLGLNKCFNVALPLGKHDKIDLTLWRQDGNTEKEFKTLVAKATPFDIQDVSNFSAILDNIEAELTFHKRLDDHGFVTQWDNVNRLLGSFIPGDLVVVSGQAKVGKSTWAINLLMHHALLGVPVMDYCLEMREERIGAKIVSYFRGIERRKITKEDVVYVRAMYGRKPFYIAHSYQFTTEQVFDTIRESVKRYGIELLVFDHLHFLVRSVQNVSNEVSATVREFKLLAEELRIPILLLCQPRKIKSKTARMTIDDLRDSSSIGQDADTVVIIHRDRLPEQEKRQTGVDQPIFKPKTEVIVDATRYNPGGVAELWFNGGMSRYFNDAKEERRFLNGNRQG